MRYYGTIIRWNESRHFGAIREDHSETEVFAPIAAFPESMQPSAGQRVSFQIIKGRRGRDEAQDVRPAMQENYTEPKPLPRPSAGKLLRRIRTFLTAAALTAALSAGSWFGYVSWQSYHAAARAQNELMVDKISEKIQAERRAWRKALENGARNHPLDTY